MNQELAYKQRTKRAVSDALESMRVLEGDHGRAWQALQDSTRRDSDRDALKSFSDRLRKTAVIIDKSIEVLAEPEPVKSLPNAPIFLEWLSVRCERIELRRVTPTRPLFQDYCRFIGEACEWEAFLDLLEASGFEVNGRRAYDASVRGYSTGGIRLRKIEETTEDAA